MEELSSASAATVEFTRVYLALFFTFVAVFYTARILLLKNKIQKNVAFAGSRFSSTWWNHLTFRVFRATIWLLCVLRLLFPDADHYLGILPNLWHWPVIVVGNILLTGGFCLAIYVHLKMGSSWRTGIDPSGPGRLIVDGLYRASRNPMYVGVGSAQLGFFFALPSMFTLLCLVLGWLTLYRQTRAEEMHLGAQFHADYQRYLHSVRRFI